MTVRELFDWAKNHDCLELDMNSRDSSGKYCKLDYLDFNIARGEIYINPIEERKVKRQFAMTDEDIKEKECDSEPTKNPQRYLIDSRLKAYIISCIKEEVAKREKMAEELNRCHEEIKSLKSTVVCLSKVIGECKEGK